MAVVIWAGRAAAAERLFDVPRQSRRDAVIALAQQAGLSLGFAPDARCEGLAGVRGRMSVDTAVQRLLEGSGCIARRLDARSLVVQSATPRSPPPSTAPPQLARPLASPVQLAEIVVTAEKREALLSSSSSGLTAVSGDALAVQGLGDAQDLALLAAGVMVTNLGPGRNKVLLRGLSDGPLTGHTQSTVGIYLGEMRLTYNAPDPDLPLIDLDRVEVLRGPQGSLYGSGSIAGVLHIVPTPPELDARSGRVAVALAATAHGRPSAEGDVVLNQPVLNGDAALRLVAWWQQSGGYIDIPTQGRRDVDRTRRSGVRITGRWRATESLELESAIVHQGISTRDAHYAEPAIGPLARSTAAAEPHDNDFTALTLTARWSPTWGRLTSTLSVLDHDVGNSYDAALAPPNLFVANARPTVFTDENEIRGLVVESRFSSYGAGRTQWTVGLFNALGEQRLDGELLTSPGGGGYRERRKDRLVEAAIFGEVSYDLNERLTVTTGGRLFASSLRTSSRVQLDADTRPFAGKTNYDGFAPKLRVAYRPLRGVALYASASEGYRTAGFNTAGPLSQAFGVGSNAAQPARRYGGDELWSLEIGARWRSPDGRLDVRTALSQARWRNVQADLLLPSGLPFTANLGEASSRTFELEATFRTRALRVSGNLVAQESELTRRAAGFPAGAEEALSIAPERMFGLSFAYDLPPKQGWQAQLDGSFAYIGRSRLAVFSTGASRMGGYSDARLGANVSSGPMRLGLSIENLLDSRGDTLAFGNPFSLRLARQTTPQRPRTIRLRLERSF